MWHVDRLVFRSCMGDQSDSPAEVKRSSYCTRLQETLFPSTGDMNQKQIDRIDTSLNVLYETVRTKQKTLKDLKNNLALLSDKSKNLDPNGQPRSVLIDQTRKRMKTILMHIKSVNGNITFFEQVKFNLETSYMTSEMAAQIKGLKEQLVVVGAINIEDVQNDIDMVAEINDDIQDINFAMKDTMSNAWTADMGDADDLLAEYLAESDDEQEDELVFGALPTKKPLVSHVRPLVEPSGSLIKKHVDALPRVPGKEEEEEEERASNVVEYF